MSTRCKIEFYTTDGKTIYDRRTIYKHTDGYPDGDYGIFAVLEKFFFWDQERLGDIEYQVANFIYWWKNLRGAEHTGIGVCNNDDESAGAVYYYKVEMNHTTKEITMRCYHRDSDFKKEIQMKIIKGLNWP